MAARQACRALRTEARHSRASFATRRDRNSRRTKRGLNMSAGKIGAMIRPAIRNSGRPFRRPAIRFRCRSIDGTTPAMHSSDRLFQAAIFCPPCFLKRPAPRRRTCLRVASTGEEFVDCNHRRAGDDGNGRHHKNSFEHGSLPADRCAKTPDESAFGKSRKLRVRDIREDGIRPGAIADYASPIRPVICATASRTRSRPLPPACCRWRKEA